MHPSTEVPMHPHPSTYCTDAPTHRRSSGTSVVVLRPSRGWVSLDLSELLRFRQLLVAMASRDVKLRYKQTLLGISWVVVQPLLAAGIFNFVFGVVAGFKTTGRSYFAFSFAGLLIWNVFSST